MAFPKVRGLVNGTEITQRTNKHTHTQLQNYSEERSRLEEGGFLTTIFSEFEKYEVKHQPTLQTVLFSQPLLADRSAPYEHC